MKKIKIEKVVERDSDSIKVSINGLHLISIHCDYSSLNYNISEITQLIKHLDCDCEVETNISK